MKENLEVAHSMSGLSACGSLVQGRALQPLCIATTTLVLRPTPCRKGDARDKLVSSWGHRRRTKRCRGGDGSGVVGGTEHPGGGEGVSRRAAPGQSPGFSLLDVVVFHNMTGVSRQSDQTDTIHSGNEQMTLAWLWRRGIGLRGLPASVRRGGRWGGGVGARRRNTRN